MQNYDVIVIGGGAAGLMCALTAGQRGRRVLVLERANRVGKKILMSGGGRCNFTNLQVTPERFLSANPHFCKSALSRYTQQNFIALVESHGIAYHEKIRGQLFCDVSSKQILAMLLDECSSAGVDIRCSCEVESLADTEGFRLETSQGSFTAGALVVATGGLSIPSLGGSDLGYTLARQFGLRVLPLRAGLVPLTFTGTFRELSARLSGVSLRARVGCAAGSFVDDILFTHHGLSGPAILQLSSYWQPGETLHLDLLPDVEIPGLLLSFKQDRPRALLRTRLAGHLPMKLVKELESLWWPARAQTPLAELPDKFLKGIAAHLGNWVLKPAGTEGYRTAEVTLGGVDTRELSSQTLECKTRPGLYFIGEVVDVSGHLGGFNFQWAWSSGWVAGQYV
jgi:predicted Rossmann fold flavoprotein